MRAGSVEKDLRRQSDDSIRKGVETFRKRIKEHEYKISHPEEFYEDWNQRNEKTNAGRIKHWEKEIKTFKKNIESRENELKRREENGKE